MQIDQVFGISPEVREYSYVDRGNLDDEMSRMLRRTTHIAVRGPSKSGKSWLRQKVLDNPITVQCRLRKPFVDIYVDALSQLDISIQVKEARQGVFKASLSAAGEMGLKLLAKVGLSGSVAHESSRGTESKLVGHDVNDLRFVAELIRASGRRLVIEDFHYMSTDDRRGFAFDLKALWDYQVFIIIIGVWSDTNLLLHLNPDLTGRVMEIPIRTQILGASYPKVDLSFTSNSIRRCAKSWSTYRTQTQGFFNNSPCLPLMTPDYMRAATI
jgi:hypothetical protein